MALLPAFILVSYPQSKPEAWQIGGLKPGHAFG
jgi:hypothetical protein